MISIVSTGKHWGKLFTIVSILKVRFKMIKSDRVIEILAHRVTTIQFTESKSDLLKSVTDFYKSLNYAHSYLNRHFNYMYSILLGSFYSALRRRTKQELLFLIRRIWSPNVSRFYNVRKSFNDLLQVLNPLECMILVK